MFTPHFHISFKKDWKRAIKRNKDINKLTLVINLILTENELPKKYKDHSLIGDYVGCKECHIEPDWLLIYEILYEKGIVNFIRTGTHADLFGK